MIISLFMADKEKENQEKYFRIHFDEPEEDIKIEVKEEKKEVKAKSNKRTLKDVLEDGFRQIIASFIILVVGFFLLNYSAYIKVFESKWSEITGNETVSPLNEIAGIEIEDNTETIVYNQEVLELENIVSEKIFETPELNLEIAPSDNRIIIPRINQNIPIIRVNSESLIARDWTALENEMQDALQDGVVHYPGTSLPGKTGNTVITGHSSYFPWDPGRFKDVFALLHNLVIGDRIVIYYDQDKYIYEVKGIDVVLPENMEVLKQSPNEKLTLITCTPIGTNLKRLIIEAEPIAINNYSLEFEEDKIKRT